MTLTQVENKQKELPPPLLFPQCKEGLGQDYYYYFFLVLADWEGELVCVSRAFQQHRPSGTPPSLHVSTEQSAGDTSGQLNAVLGSRDTQPAVGNKTSYGQTFQVTNPQARVHHFQKPQHNSRPEKKKKSCFPQSIFKAYNTLWSEKQKNLGVE